MHQRPLMSLLVKDPQFERREKLLLEEASGRQQFSQEQMTECYRTHKPLKHLREELSQ
jgi:hypothetical protein